MRIYGTDEEIEQGDEEKKNSDFGIGAAGQLKKKYETKKKRRSAKGERKKKATRGIAPFFGCGM